ncbi:MAG: PilZ domain-containing protein [Spirochaetia bacterium]|nr:PilZ domain-containing protein [Spirochaetia bacterium]
MPQGNLYMNRRKHARVQKKMAVIYKVMAGDEFETVSPDIERKRNVESEDISTSGMQLICDESLDPDRIVRLDVKLGGTDELVTFAEVRWVRKDESIKKYRIGLEFLVVKEDHINSIKKITGE